MQNVFIVTFIFQSLLSWLPLLTLKYSQQHTVLISDDDITSSHGPINILFKLKTLDRIFELINVFQGLICGSYVWIICVTIIVHKSISILSMVSIS